MANKSRAIVVGITRYRHYPELGFGRLNATELALTLEGLGFTVRLLLNGQLSRPSVLFDALDESVGSDADRILVYYCGYGVTRLQDHRLLVAHTFSTPDRMRTHIDLADMASHLAPAQATQIAIVLDTGLSEFAFIEDSVPHGVEILSARIDYRVQTRSWHKSGLSFFTGHIVELLRQGKSFIPVLSLSDVSLRSQRAHKIFCPNDTPPTFCRFRSGTRGQFTFWDDGDEGLIPRDTLYQFKRPLAGVREDAIQDLADYYSGLDAKLRTEAQEELLRLAGEDASESVRRFACEVLIGRVAGGFLIDWPVKNVAEASDIETVFVPAGEFLMGSTDETRIAELEEKPQHKLYLDAFRIGKSPITNGQYHEFCQRTGYSWPPHWTPQ